MNRQPSLLWIGLLGLLVFLPGERPATAAGFAKNGHRFSLLVGFPETSPAPSGQPGREPSKGVLIVPGTVLPLGSEPLRKESAERADLLAELADKLRGTVRLREVKVVYDLVVNLEVDQERPLPAPAPGSGVAIRVTLLGSSDQLATYRVVFTEGGKPITNSNVSVQLGKRAVIGGLNGPEAPYLFLVAEPLRRGGPKEEIAPPQLLRSVQPVYPADGKKEKIAGLVILSAEIGTDGAVRGVNVLQGLSHGLTEAAVDAVKQWKFKPALDARGKPVAVLYTLTINFKLE